MVHYVFPELILVHAESSSLDLSRHAWAPSLLGPGLAQDPPELVIPPLLSCLSLLRQLLPFAWQDVLSFVLGAVRLVLSVLVVEALPP